MQNAKATGVKVSQKPTAKDDIPSILCKHYPAYAAKKMNINELARVCKLNRPTVYKYLKAHLLPSTANTKAVPQENPCRTAFFILPELYLRLQQLQRAEGSILQVLRNDKRLIVSASGKAAKAVDWILNSQH